MPLAEDVDLHKLASTTHGFVGADLESLCKEAAMRVVEEELFRKSKTMKKFQKKFLKKSLLQTMTLNQL